MPRRLACGFFLAASFPARANVFATVHGVVHDPRLIAAQLRYRFHF
jgi:hypothetical protein